MARTKLEVQLQLLKELDSICEKNNINYILFGTNALNAYRNGSLSGGARIVAVAMTAGDIERFCNIIDSSYKETRFVEGMFNNPRSNSRYVIYGDKNTTDIKITSDTYNKHRGIRIRIYPIKTRRLLDGTLIEEWDANLITEDKIRKRLNRRLLTKSRKQPLVNASRKILGNIYVASGRSGRFYKKLRSRTFIDKWEDIADYKEVTIDDKNSIKTEFLREIAKYNVDGIELCMPKNGEEYFASVYGPDFRDIKIRDRKPLLKELVSTEVGYEYVMKEHGDLLAEARKYYEIISVDKRKAAPERRDTSNVWWLVKMTKEQISLIELFDEIGPEIMKLDINDEEDYKRLYSLVQPVIISWEKYQKREMTFSISKDIDDLVKCVLIHEGRQDMVEALELISNKEYYVE